MQYLDLEDVRAGMVLGLSLHDDRGRVLLPAGCTLGAVQLHALREHRVTRVPVQTPRPATAKDSCDPGEAAARDREIDARFRFCDARHPLIDELRRLCRLRSEGAKGRSDDD